MMMLAAQNNSGSVTLGSSGSRPHKLELELNQNKVEQMWVLENT